MGFLETLGKAVSAGNAKLKEMQEEQNRLYEEYQSKTDQQLMRLAHGVNFSRKMVAMKVLKERGYTNI